MGIRGLRQFLSLFDTDTNKNPLCNFEKLLYLKNKKIAIDFNQYLFKYLYQYKKIKTIETEIQFIERKFKELYLKLRKYNILVCFIFDGKPIKEKQTILDKRKAKVHKYTTELKHIISTFSTTLHNPLQNTSLLQETETPLKTEIINTCQTLLLDDKEIKNEQQKYLTPEISSNTTLENTPPSSPIISKTSIKKLKFETNSKPEITDIYTPSTKYEDFIEPEQLENQPDKKEYKPQDIQKIINRTTKIEYIHCHHMKQCFIKHKIPFIHLPDFEADLVCKWVVEYNIVDYCLSNDLDMLAYGCKNIISNFDYNNETIEIFNYQEILNTLKLTPSQFLDICISCGTDYNSRITETYFIYQLLTTYKYNNLYNIITELPNINSKIKDGIILFQKTPNTPHKIVSIYPPVKLDYKYIISIFNSIIPLDILQQNFIK